MGGRVGREQDVIAIASPVSGKQSLMKADLPSTCCGLGIFMYIAPFTFIKTLFSMSLCNAQVHKAHNIHVITFFNHTKKLLHKETKHNHKNLKQVMLLKASHYFSHLLNPLWGSQPVLIMRSFSPTHLVIYQQWNNYFLHHQKYHEKYALFNTKKKSSFTIFLDTPGSLASQNSTSSSHCNLEKNKTKNDTTNTKTIHKSILKS